jgi:manganese-dependent ADP-ribose/CDP-alcohol diphosphatase
MNRRKFIGISTAAVSLPTARGATEETPLLSFGLLTDVQYADADPQGERHYRESPGKLKTAVEWLAGKKLPFTLHLGDFIDRDFKSFDAVLPLLDGLGHPVRHLLGNHDYDVAEGEKGLVTAKLGMPGDTYSFVSSGVRFVMLDTNDVSVYKHPEGSPEDKAAEAVLKTLEAEKSPAGKKWNGGLSAKQLAWLDGELTAADKAGEPVILCGHHPLLPAEMHQAWNADEVTAVIDRHPCIRAYFNGHNHAGAEKVRNGVPFITFKSLLHEPGLNSYSVIRLFKDKLEIVGNGREQSRVIALRTA